MLLHTARDHRRSSSSTSAEQRNDVPFMQLTVIQENIIGSTLQHFNYICFRILQVEIAVDSGTLQLLLSDLISDLEFVSRDEIIATKVPEKWIAEYNLRQVSVEERSRLVDVYSSQRAAQASRMYFEKLQLHPIKIILTFVQTPFPRKKDQTETFSTSAAVLDVLATLVGVDRMEIRLKSFIVNEAMESAASLWARILAKIWRDLQFQIAHVAGSLTMLGSPVGLARNIGEGLQDFFYEPYQGLVQSPQDFVIGLGKGTSSLVAGVVSGALNSTVAIVGTASTGIALLSGDLDFVRARTLQQQRSLAARGGLVSGAQEGIASVYSGFASGISGVITKPIEEAKRDGPIGFLRGVGLGIIGVAVKPVLGVTDGLTSVAQGISNQVGDKICHIPVRPPRAFERSEADCCDLVLVPLDIRAAIAQEFVLLRAQDKGYKDAFITRISLTNSDAQAVVLSEVYFYWYRENKKLWGRAWADISHCVYADEGVHLMMYGPTKEEVLITCGDKKHSLELYSALVRNSHRMGNPSYVLPVEVVVGQSQGTGTDISTRPVPNINLQSDLEGYKFGQANHLRFSSVVYSEIQILNRAELRLKTEFQGWHTLDEFVWQLIWEWDMAHRGLKASRCCATIILNRSNSPIQISRTQVLEGRSLHIFHGTGYDPDSRSISPKGIVVIFVCAFSPSPLEIGHLKAIIMTPAFTATLGSRRRETKCEGHGGFAAGFLEKTWSRWWTKNVIMVT